MAASKSIGDALSRAFLDKEVATPSSRILLTRMIQQAGLDSLTLKNDRTSDFFKVSRDPPPRTFNARCLMFLVGIPSRCSLDFGVEVVVTRWLRERTKGADLSARTPEEHANTVVTNNTNALNDFPKPIMVSMVVY